MIRTLLFLAALLLAQILPAQYIPNASFEIWDNLPVPLYWQTNSQGYTVPPYGPYIVKQDTHHVAGSYAANFYGNNVLKPYAINTFAISTHPSYLSLFYSLSFAPCINDPSYQQKDTASILVELLHNGATVDSGYWESTLSSLSYSHLTIPISQQAAAFESCRITIMGGRINGGCGFVAAPTEFRVDKLELLNSATTACSDTGVVVAGVECPLISDFATGTLLHPCTMPAGASLHVGDTVTYSYSLSSCVSICMQGTDVAVSCYQVLTVGQIPAQPCHAYFSWSKDIDSVTFYNQSHADSVTGYSWSFGDGSTSATTSPTHVYAHDTTYIVCLHMTGLDYGGSPCSDTYCDTIFITHDCIDSTLLCPVPPGALCCDLSPPDTVCGCDSVTYYNACYAARIGGVARYYHGPCVSTHTGIDDPAEAVYAITLAPVPAGDRVVLTYQMRSSATTTIRILSAIGQELRAIDPGATDAGRHQARIDLTGLSAGIYLLEIKSGATTRVKRFIKE
ncbi:MAG: T9SS type A sorting domain-containing protein [Bacteroidetes bacterium]|nr:T9SS type A sorting domain-containing protein [Bacteroidota bacterium]